MSYLPFFLKLGPTDRIVMIGGGAIALAKMETLTAVAPQVRIVAETIASGLKNSGAEIIKASYVPEHLDGAALVIAATDSEALNLRIYHDAKARGIKVNVVDTPALCDFIFPAIVKRGDVQIAISTSGISPVLARALKRRIEQLLPWNFGLLAEWLQGKRIAVRKSISNMQSRRLFWDEVIEGPMAQEVLEGNYAKAELLFAQSLASAPQAPRAALYLIGAGPGHPDLLTVKATQLLGLADMILYDRLTPPELLSRYARKEAEKIAVGKSRDAHSKTQEDIDALLEEKLLANKIVVRLKGGDPGIYAHAAEEIAIASRLGVPYQIVPGITAALGCAATAGIPLTERGGAQSVRFLTFYDESLQDEALWYSLSASRGETLVFYMATQHRDLLCQQLIAHGFKADVPVLIIEQGTTPQHAEYEATLGTLAERYKDFPFITPTLMIIGDVVRWREKHGWKEQPQERASYFGAAEKRRA